MSAIDISQGGVSRAEAGAEEAAAPAGRQGSASAHSFLLIPILLLFALLTVAVLRSPSLITQSGIGSAIIVAAPLILATYALTIIVMAGRGGVDLSIGPLIGFINVTLVQLFAAGIVTSVVDVFLYAIVVGVLYQIIVGLIIVYVRIQPIIVALAGYLTLAGLNLVILPRPGGTAPDWMQPWGLGEDIVTPVLGILVVATGAWFLFTRTAFYNHLRLMGADERTAFTAGVNITAVRLGAHIIAGVYAALAAICFTSLISSGDPTQGSTYTLMAVTALVLGGTSLAGGRGSIIGSLLGALNIYLITYVLATFNFGMVQSFVTQLAYGTILVAALLLTIFLPLIQRSLRWISPYILFVFLALAALGVMLYARDVVMAPVGQSLSGQSLSGQSLSGQSLSGQSLSGQSLSGQSLSGQSLSGQSLSGQSLSGQSLSGQSLSGQSLSGQSLSAQAEAPPAPTATPVMVAAVIIAAIIFLIYLLVRFISLYTILFIGVLALLLLGYSVYEGGVPGMAGGPAEGGGAAALSLPYLISLGGWPAGPEAEQAWLLASPLLSGGLFVLGAILLGSVLIFTTVPQAGGRIGPTGLLFMALGGAAIALVFVYESERLASAGDNLFVGAWGMILVGALLFVIALPTFQGRIRNVSLVILTLLSLVALATTFFAAGPETAPGAAPAPVAAPPAPLPGAEGLEPARFSDAYFGAVALVLLAGAVLFLLMIGGVRRHVMKNISFAPGVRAFSYTGLFIAVSATLFLGAVFLVAGVEIWRIVVVLVGGLIAARFAFAFLLDFRRKYGRLMAEQNTRSPASQFRRG